MTPMEATSEAAVLVGALLFLSKLGEEGAERLGLPGFIGSVLTGLFLSPAVLGLVKPSDLVPALLLFNLGINFTLFLAGVEELSNPSLLKPSRREVYVSFALLASVTLLVGLFALYFMGLRLETSLAVGVVLAIVSAGPLMKLLFSKGRLGEREYSALKVGLIVEIGGLTIFNTLVQGFNAAKFLETLVFVLLVYLVGRHYLDELLLLVERYVAVREAPFAIVVSIVIMAGYIAELIGFNAAVTALLLGVFLSEYMEIRPLYLERVRAFTYGFLEPLFFIGIGIYAVRPTLIDTLYSLVLLALSAMPKMLAARLLGLSSKEGLAFLAKGGVDAALLLTMLQNGELSYSAYTAALLATLGSTLLSAAAHRVKERRPDILRMRLSDIDLDMAIVHADEKADYAARVVASKGAAVVVDKNMRPIGYVTAEDFVDVDPRMLETIPARFFLRSEVPVVRADKIISDLLSDPSLLHEPIIAVVNEKGEVIGTINSRRLLNLLLKLTRQEHGGKRTSPPEGGSTEGGTIH